MIGIDEKEVRETASRIVSQEVRGCVSSLVSTLASGAGCNMQKGDLRDLTEQAQELSYGNYDYEEAAIQEGWEGPFEDEDGAVYFKNEKAEEHTFADDWEELCSIERIEPYQWEVFEHWIVSDWLGRKLESHGEKVDFDFAGLVVWARTTTGQGISADYVITKIAEAIVKNKGG